MTRAIRGAVHFHEDDKKKIEERVQFLLDRILAENGVGEEDIVSIFFTTTNDLLSVNPAAALRQGGGFADTPLFCSQEPETDGALRMVIRVMLICESSTPKNKLRHIYIDGAERLRPDLN